MNCLWTFQYAKFRQTRPTCKGCRPAWLLGQPPGRAEPPPPALDKPTGQPAHSNVTCPINWFHLLRSLPMSVHHPHDQLLQARICHCFLYFWKGFSFCGGNVKVSWIQCLFCPVLNDDAITCKLLSAAFIGINSVCSKTMVRAADAMLWFKVQFVLIVQAPQLHRFQCVCYPSRGRDTLKIVRGNCTSRLATALRSSQTGSISGVKMLTLTQKRGDAVHLPWGLAFILNCERLCWLDDYFWDWENFWDLHMLHSFCSFIVRSEQPIMDHYNTCNLASVHFHCFNWLISPKLYPATSMQRNII